MMLGIARSLKQIGNGPGRPHSAPWQRRSGGVSNSKYDWSTGAYEQVFTARPQWQGQVTANLNFELPAHAHGAKRRCAAPMNTGISWKIFFKG